VTEEQLTNPFQAIEIAPPAPLGSFDLRFAAAMARLANLAYSPFETDNGVELRKLLAPGALTLRQTFSWIPSDVGLHPRSWRDRGTQGYLVYGARYAALVFRGTTDTTDWKTDLRARKVVVRSEDHIARVHAGFGSAYSQVSPKIESAVTELMSADRLPLFIVGHSLGGALAQIALASLAYDRIAACYTFGSLSVASAWYRTDLRAPHHRIVNGWDVVPEVPTIFRGYAHTEASWRLKKDPPKTVLSRGRFILRALWINLRSLVGAAFGKDWVGVRDHAMTNYIARLDAVTAK
jgi:hypothetical protein